MKLAVLATIMVLSQGCGSKDKKSSPVPPKSTETADSCLKKNRDYNREKQECGAELVNVSPQDSLIQCRSAEGMTEGYCTLNNTKIAETTEGFHKWNINFTMTGCKKWGNEDLIVVIQGRDRDSAIWLVQNDALSPITTYVAKGPLTLSKVVFTRSDVYSPEFELWTPRECRLVIHEVTSAPFNPEVAG